MAAKVISKVPQAASRFNNFLTKGTALSGTGAVEAGLYSAGKANPGEWLEDAAQGAKIGAAVAPVVGGVTGAISNRMAKNKVNKLVSDNTPSRETLKESASKAYDELDKLDVTISKNAFNGLLNNMQVRAKNFGFNKKISPKTAAALKEFEKLRGTTPSLKDIDILRRVMGQAASSIEPSERKLAVLLIDAIDDTVSNLTPDKVITGNGKQAGEMYKQARTLWSRNRKSELLEGAIDTAKQTASGFENGLRIEFRKILNSKKLSKGFSPEEIKAMRKVVNGSVAGNLSKWLGKLGINEKQATSMAGSFAGIGGGAYFGGPLGAIAVPIAGQTAKVISSRITQKHARLANELVKSGKNGKSIVDSYIRNVKDKNPKDLAALLIDNEADIPKLEKALDGMMGPKRKMVTDALALIAGGGLAVNQDD